VVTYSAQVNDLVGGWIVTDYPHPLSEHDNRPGGDQPFGTIVAECSTEFAAKLISHLLNTYEDGATFPACVRCIIVGRLGEESEEHPYHIDWSRVPESYRQQIVVYPDYRTNGAESMCRAHFNQAQGHDPAA
jgi:hypothetical protein